MKFRNIFIALSMISNLALMLGSAAAFMFYTTDAGLILGGFMCIALSVSNATLSLHFRDTSKDES